MKSTLCIGVSFFEQWRRDSELFDKRKKIIYDFICDDFYVPMKFKEMAMVLQVKRSSGMSFVRCWKRWKRKVRYIFHKRGKYCKGEAKRLRGTVPGESERDLALSLLEGRSEDIFIGEDDA